MSIFRKSSQPMTKSDQSFLSQSESKPKRDQSFDIITGIMIIWVVVCHILQWSGLVDTIVFHSLARWLFFVMPWFYFKSGNFHARSQALAYPSYLRKIANDTIFPLVIWGTIGLISWFPDQLTTSNISTFHLLKLPISQLIRSGDIISNQPLWFFLSFFFVKAIAYPVIKIKHTPFILPISILIGSVFSHHSIILPFGIHTIPLGLFFYCCGHIYSTHFNARNIQGRALILLWMGYVICNILLKSNLDFHNNALIRGYYFGFASISLLAILISIKTFQACNSPLLSLIGTKSMQIFVAHWPILSLIRTICTVIGVSTRGWSFALILTATSIPLLTFISSNLPGSALKYSPKKSRLMREKTNN